jgi:hypothetical protein
MSFFISFHLTSGSRDRRGYDYHMYTCMNPDSAQFHNMASNLHFWGSEGDHKILYHCPLPLELDSIILARSGKPISLDNEYVFTLIKVS